jgi:tetratricopeptide (TPR) repeat protein
VAEERRQFDEAERWYRQSLAIGERIGNEHGQAISLHQLGMVAEVQGDRDRALMCYRQAEALFLQLHDPHNLEIVRLSIQRVNNSKP